jgi:hypothetical protein
MNKRNTFSAFPRFFSIKNYASHRKTFIIALMTGLFIFGYKYYGDNVIFSQAIVLGTGAFFASFVVWAISRELDPDRASRASLAQLLLVPAWLLTGPLAILPSTIVIGSSRYLSHITGLSWTRWDRLALLLGATGMMLYFQEPAFGLFGALVFGMEAFLNDDRPANIRLFIVSTMSSAIYILYFWQASSASRSSIGEIILSASAFFALVHFLRIKTIVSLSDYNEKAIEPKRLRLAIVASLSLPVMSYYFFSGNPQQFALILLALVASAI